MRKANLISAIILLVIIAGCIEKKQSSTNDFITVDITKNYSHKKELILQDFMDVEYIVLEMNDEFTNEGFVLDIGKEIILVRNYNDDGNIFVYDRHGKALRKINRKGQGGEEYINIYNIILDENNEEMFVNDIFSQKIATYDLCGNFKRSFRHKKDSGTMFYSYIFNYDKDNLICYDQHNEKIPFILISKQDGNITKEIKVPFKKRLLLQQQLIDGDGKINTVSPGPYRSIIIYKDSWMLSEVSSDTVYTLSPDYSLHPFLARAPSIQTMDTGVFLVLRLFSDRYIFMETIKNEYNWNTGGGFSRTFFMYDKQEKVFSGYAVYNDDYSSKKEIYMNWLRPMNHEIESWQALQAHHLVESYAKGELKGKLKEIAATLDEDSNPVIMLIKHKKND